MKGFVKDPDAILDYGFDWTLWLDGDTIATSSWILDAGISIQQGTATYNNTKTSVYISGGVKDGNYKVTNRITTASGRTDDRSFTLRVRQR
jgi:hypothetical protein